MFNEFINLKKKNQKKNIDSFLFLNVKSNFLNY